MKRSFCQSISILHIFIVLDPSWDWKQKYGNIIVNSHLTQLNSNSKQVTNQRKKGEKIKKIKSKKPLQNKKMSIYHLKYFVNNDTVHLFFISTINKNANLQEMRCTSRYSSSNLYWLSKPSWTGSCPRSYNMVKYFCTVILPFHTIWIVSWQGRKITFSRPFRPRLCPFQTLSSPEILITWSLVNIYPS